MEWTSENALEAVHRRRLSDVEKFREITLVAADKRAEHSLRTTFIATVSLVLFLLYFKAHVPGILLTAALVVGLGANLFFLNLDRISLRGRTKKQFKEFEDLDDREYSRYRDNPRVLEEDE